MPDLSKVSSRAAGLDTEDAFGGEAKAAAHSGQQEERGEELAKGNRHKQVPGAVAQVTHGDSNQRHSTQTGTGQGAARLRHFDSLRKI